MTKSILQHIKDGDYPSNGNEQARVLMANGYTAIIYTTEALGPGGNIFGAVCDSSGCFKQTMSWESFNGAAYAYGPSWNLLPPAPKDPAYAAATLILKNEEQASTYRSESLQVAFALIARTDAARAVLRSVLGQKGGRMSVGEDQFMALSKALEE